jgi:pimeloyl-ACP methyl ester carboxylesterase
MGRVSQIVTAGEATIETYVDGSGPDVVLLPSYGRDGGDDFDPLTAALAGAGYRVLRPQPRGTARSAGPMTGVSLDDQGDDIARVLDELGRGPAVILGHAYGNFIARVLATSHPGKVSAVILAAASGRTVAPEVNTAPLRAGDPSLPDPVRMIEQAGHLGREMDGQTRSHASVRDQDSDFPLKISWSAPSG